MLMAQQMLNATRQPVDLEPLCLEAHIYAGLAMLQEGRLDEARSELQKAVFLDPSTYPSVARAGRAKRCRSGCATSAAAGSSSPCAR